MYKKGKLDPLLLPIKRVAQSKQFYGSIEHYLTHDIEQSANIILNKVRNREVVSNSEKLVLSRYIFVFWKRVRPAFERFQEKSPEVARFGMQNLNASLSNIEVQNPDKAEHCEKLRREGQRIFNDLAQNPEREIWAKSIKSRNNERIAEVMSKMTWVFYTCSCPSIFITSDNPVFIHRSFGIGKTYSDMTFPISKEVTLLTTWRRGSDLCYREASPQQIKELNRRTVFNASRFAFASKNRAWITGLMNKSKHQIHFWVQRFPDKLP